MPKRAKASIPGRDKIDAEYASCLPQALTPSGRPVIRVAIVNNMPEAAFEETHREFSRLVHASVKAQGAELRWYRIPAVAPGTGSIGSVAEMYRDLEELYRNPPDALVITGAEPATREITDERYWGALDALLQWAESTVPSTLLSCLAAHGALRALDQADRVRLPAKRSGVYPQAVDQSHPLGRGLGVVAAFPHSRWNTVTGDIVRSLGYSVVVGTPGEEWTVAARERAGRMLVLVQGHPEYEPTMLLREYRRDMRRWAEGVMPAPPEFPSNYVDPCGEELLAAWIALAEYLPPAEWSHAFPADTLAPHLAADWRDAAVRLFGNWLEDAGARARPLLIGGARA
jgi:homoserine O-succinyltransferase